MSLKIYSSKSFFKQLLFITALLVLKSYTSAIGIEGQNFQPIIPGPASKVPESCNRNCDSAYGSTIGINSNVFAFSNCNNDCVNFEEEGVILYKNQTNFVEDVYTGVRWQCVEYARRWLVLNKMISFSTIDSAFEIFDLPNVTKILTNEEVLRNETQLFYEFLSFENKNKIAPASADLIIFPKSKDSPYGHVAVITEVNHELGFVKVAEQNYFNKVWKFSDFSRQLVMKKDDNDNYTLHDIEWKEDSRELKQCTDYIGNSEEVIHQENKKIKYCLNPNSVIGWKRVGKIIKNKIN